MSRFRQVWAATHVGHVRQGNEDCCCVGDWLGEGRAASWRGEIDCALGWAAIADGMGGHAAGELASRSVVQSIMELAGDAQSVADVERMLETANERLYKEMYGDQGQPAMGSTVVGFVVRDARALIFNVGDSRFYVINGQGLKKESIDDTPEIPIDETPSFKRSHVLTQSLGGGYMRTPLKPHIRFLDFDDAAQLLLCSDGLTDMLSDAEIVSVLMAQPRDPAAALISAALEAGGADNVTVVVVGAATA